MVIYISQEIEYLIEKGTKMKYLSRKFLLATGIILLIIANNKFNLGLGIDSQPIVKQLVLLALAYIGVQGAVDAINELKKK